MTVLRLRGGKQLSKRPPGYVPPVNMPYWLNRFWACPNRNRTGWFTALMAICRMKVLARKRTVRMLALNVLHSIHEPMLRKSLCEEAGLL